jgi:hypothetical protein
MEKQNAIVKSAMEKEFVNTGKIKVFAKIAAGRHSVNMID